MFEVGTYVYRTQTGLSSVVVFYTKNVLSTRAGMECGFGIEKESEEKLLNSYFSSLVYDSDISGNKMTE